MKPFQDWNLRDSESGESRPHGPTRACSKDPPHRRRFCGYHIRCDMHLTPLLAMVCDSTHMGTGACNQAASRSWQGPWGWKTELVLRKNDGGKEQVLCRRQIHDSNAFGWLALAVSSPSSSTLACKHRITRWANSFHRYSYSAPKRVFLSRTHRQHTIPEYPYKQSHCRCGVGAAC
jgi:hypothetical protein